MTAPVIGDDAFGYITERLDGSKYYGYLCGNNHRIDGTNTLHIHRGATGYDQGQWADVLLNPDQCGFHIEYLD